MLYVLTYEGADDKHNTLNHARRQAVAERLATTSGHEDKHISACQRCLDGRLLPAPESREPCSPQIKFVGTCS